MTTPATRATDPLTLGITTDVGAVANSLAALFKLIDGINAVVNSPTAVALRQSAAVQKALEQMDADLAEAKKTGDLTQINKDASG